MLAALLPLLALAFGNPTPVAGVRVGVANMPMRAVVGVAPAGGGGWLTAWEDGSQVTLAPSHANGTRRQIPAWAAALASSPRGPILLWTRNGELRIAPLAGDGSFAAPPTLLTTFTNGLFLQLACNENGCAATVDATLWLLDRDFRVLGTRTLSGQAEALVADPTGFLVLRRASYPPATGIVAERVDGNGVTTMSRTILEDVIAHVAADFDGERYAIVYGPAGAYGTPEYGLIAGVSLALDGTLGPRRIVYRSRLASSEIALAWNGATHALAVSDISGPGLVLEITLFPTAFETVSLDRDLNVLGAPATIRNDDTTVRTPRIAASDGRFFLAYEHIGAVTSVRTIEASPSGTVGAILTTGPVPQLSPTIAAAEGRDLVLWLEPEEKMQLRYRRLPQDSESGMLSEARVVGRASAASLGSDWLVAWGEQATMLPTSATCKAAILNAFVDGPQRLDIHEPCALVYGVAAADNGWMLAFSANRQLRVARVTRSGQVLPSMEIGLSDDAAIVANGPSFLVASARSSLGVDLRRLDANGAVTASQHIDAQGALTIAAMAARRDFLVAIGSDAGVSVYAVSSTLAVEPKAHLGGRSNPLHLVPFHGGALVTWGTHAQELDVDGNEIGPAVIAGAPIFDVAPHGNEATIVFVGTSQRVMTQPLLATNSDRRRATRP